MSLQVNLAGLELEHPVINAAGTCKLIDGNHGVQKLAMTATAAIMVGSITLEERPGNAGDVYGFDQRRGFSLNSLGLPCRGWPYYEQHLPEMVQIAHDAGKPLFVSVAGFAPHEYGDLTGLAFAGGADLVEINLGCPNVWAAGTQKRNLCFDPDLVRQTLSIVERRAGVHARVAVKLSPFSDPHGLVQIAAVLNGFSLVKVVTSTNTFPNGFAFSSEGSGAGSMITQGLAGMAGPALKPIGLGQVKQLRALLDPRIQIMGVGGIIDGSDVKDYLAVGAVVTQIATTYLEGGSRVFSRLLEELTI